MKASRFPLMRRGLIAAPCLVLMLAAGCMVLPRYRAVAPGRDPYPAEKLAAQIDPWLVGERFSDRTVIEIDWVEGCKPGPQTVDGLDAILKKYGPPNHPVELVRDQEIPRSEWDELKSVPDRIDRLVQKYANVERGGRSVRFFAAFSSISGAAEARPAPRSRLLADPRRPISAPKALRSARSIALHGKRSEPSYFERIQPFVGRRGLSPPSSNKIAATVDVERASVPGTEWRYVLFVPDAGRFFGYSSAWLVERGGVTTVVSGLIVSRSAHRKFAKLWISLDRLERMTLIHEFGHLLGLVGNPRHERSDPAHRQHCTSLKCAMAHPTPRVIARNFAAGVFNVFLTDYCADCQADIRRAQAYWRDREREGPAYRERRQRERAAQTAALSIQSLVKSEHYEEMLNRVRELRGAWPEYAEWDEVEAEALIGLDRIDEALVVQVRALPTDLAAPTYWRSRWRLAPLYMGAGRYDDAIALFDRAALARAEEYDFEQCAFGLGRALASSGRYDDAVGLIDELLARKNPLNYWPEGMRTRHAELLRRAGRMQEAEDAVSSALGDRRDRAIWLEQAARLRHAQGRTADERALWQELLQVAEKSISTANDATASTSLGWSAVHYLARLGRIDEARARAASVEAAADGVDRPLSRLWTELPARAALGDLDRIAELIRAVPAVERTVVDPCQIEDLAPMREMPKYADLFRLCPPTSDRATHAH